MSDVTTSEIVKNGLWTNNPALVQLLGLCPLLAVTGSVVNALGLGIATLAVLVGSNTIVSLIRNHVSDAVRLPAFVIIIAAFVTCAELLMKAFTYDLYQILGIFIPLIVTNCAILGRAEAFASKNKVGLAALDGLMMGLGFLVVLVALGAIRNIICRYASAIWRLCLFVDIAAFWRKLQFFDCCVTSGCFLGDWFFNRY
jgi:electron transport complex protein RnfE